MTPFGVSDFILTVVLLHQFLTRLFLIFQKPIKGMRWLLSKKGFRRTLLAILLVLASLWIAALCVFQFWLFPRINDYRDRLAGEVGHALGVRVEVAELSAGWHNFHPAFTLKNVSVFDGKQQPAILLNEVRAELAWLPMLIGSLGFRALEVDTPLLDFRRDAQGDLFLSGLALGGDGDFRVDALLEQGLLKLKSAEVRWSDQFRKAPTLVLQDVYVKLRSRGDKHRLEVAVTPPVGMGSPIRGRIDWYGTSFSDWRMWALDVDLDVVGLDLAPWVAWFDYPVPIKSGKLTADISLSIQDMRLSRLEGKVALAGLNTTLPSANKSLVLNKFATKIGFKGRGGDGITELALEDLIIVDAVTEDVEPPAKLMIKTSGGDARRQISLNGAHLNIGQLRRLSEALPLPEQLLRSLSDAAPTGVVDKIKFEGVLTGDQLLTYDARGFVRDLSIRSTDGRTFVRGLAAKFDVNQDSGKLNFETGKSVLGAPDILPINEVPLDLLKGQMSWNMNKDQLSVQLKNLQLKNADLHAEVDGSWSGVLTQGASEVEKAGTIDMKIVFEDAKTESGWKYIPLSASPDISKWVRGAISGGVMTDFRIEMAGRVWDMPYGSPEPGAPAGSSEATGAPGKFYLGFKTKDVNVKYADGYPALEKLSAVFEMNQNQIRIVADKGQINGMVFNNIRATMADVSAYENHLLVSGQGEGPTASALSYLKDTPLADHIHHFADDMSASGNGKLDIGVDLNLAVDSDVRVQGQYAFMNNRLMLLANTPPVSAVSGTIRFTESSIDSRDLQGTWSGEPLTIRIATNHQGSEIQANGRASMAELRQFYDLPVFEQLSGKTDWQASLLLRGGRVDLKINSDLRGVTSSLPEPFNKSAGATMPLAISRQSLQSPGRNAPSAQGDLWRWTLGNATSGVLALNQRGQLVRGKVVVGAGQSLVAPDQPGLNLESLRPVDLDFWLRAAGLAGGKSTSSRASKSPGLPLAVSIKAPVVKAFGRNFQDVRATVQSADERTSIQMASKELRGDMTWFPPGKGEAGERGLLQGHLNRLDLTAATETQPGHSVAPSQEIESLPDLSFKVDELLWQGQPWGKLSFRARNQKIGQNQSWRVDPFQLEGPDLRLSGRLNWVTRASSSKLPPLNLTSMDFKLNSPQVGNLLTKLGYPGTVKRGTATMDGQVSWPASPFGFDPARLSGNFKMTAKNGQFSKMDPGVGRLLGLLSLQSLPQRLTLDFRDIFSDGLAFEAIEGRFDIRDGLMKTSDLEMDAPAAKILMRGETNLALQTQDVMVTVRPSLSNSIALGVTVLNPIVGAAAFVAQKVLDDPLSKVFSFQYHITGTWSDPLVDKESLATDVVKAGVKAVDMTGNAIGEAKNVLSPGASIQESDATKTPTPVKELSK